MQTEDLAREILELHKKTETTFFSGKVSVCGHCCTGDPYVTVSDVWPCPTAVIALRALGREA